MESFGYGLEWGGCLSGMVLRDRMNLSPFPWVQGRETGRDSEIQHGVWSVIVQGTQGRVRFLHQGKMVKPAMSFCSVWGQRWAMGQSHRYRKGHSENKLTAQLRPSQKKRRKGMGLTNMSHSGGHNYLSLTSILPVSPLMPGSILLFRTHLLSCELSKSPRNIQVTILPLIGWIRHITRDT
jgi:hypothetical protein